MDRSVILHLLRLLTWVTCVMAQDATSTSNPLQDFIGAVQSGAKIVNSANSASAPASTSDSLDNFIGAAQSGASAINSANSQTASPTSTSPASAAASSATNAATSAAVSHPHGLSTGAKIGIIVGSIVAALLLLALLICLCLCCLRRRRRRRKSRVVMPEKEVENWQTPPTTPGPTYAAVPRNGRQSMEHRQTAPLIAGAGAGLPHSSHSQAPSLSQHPALRNDHHYARDAAIAGAGGLAAYKAGQHHESHKHAKSVENPFVPTPPISRRPVPSSGPVESSSAVPVAAGGALPALQHFRKHSRSRSRSNPRPVSTNIATAAATGHPSTYDPNRPPTPFGLNAFNDGPKNDPHAHLLQTDPPSTDLRRSLHEHESGIAAPGAASLAGATIEDGHRDRTYHRRSRGYDTPPEVPSRSPNREKSANSGDVSNITALPQRPHPWTANEPGSHDSSHSTTTTTTTSTSGAEQYQSHPDPYQPANQIPHYNIHNNTIYHEHNREPTGSINPWERHQFQNRDSYTTPPSSASIPPPPVPWSEDYGPEYQDHLQQTPIQGNRQNSHSPRHSFSSESGRRMRRKSHSPANSVHRNSNGNGNGGKRLRWEDLDGGQHPDGRREGEVGDGYDHWRRSQGVGEAM